MTTKKQTPRTKQPTGIWQRLSSRIARPFKRLRESRQLAVHKSFSLTRRRDLPEKPNIEGIFRFTGYVGKTVWQNKALFGRFLLLYVVAAILFAGLVQSQNIKSTTETVDTLNADGTVVGPLLKAAMVTATSLTSTLVGSSLTDIQQLYMSVLYLFACLVVIWLLRQRLADNTVKLRDALYNAGAPVVAIVALIGVGILQLVPLAIMTLLFSTAVANGILTGGIPTALFSIALFLFAVLTLYFLLTTLFAALVATIPGTYPMRVYKTAKQIVVGQRLRLLTRMLWLVVVIVVFWFVLLVPIAVTLNALSLNTATFLSIFSHVAFGCSILFGSAYFYLLYRRMIDDPVAK